MRVALPRDHVNGPAARIGHGIVEHAVPRGLIALMGIKMRKFLEALAVGIKAQHASRIVEQERPTEGVEKYALRVHRTDTPVVGEPSGSEIVGNKMVARICHGIEDAAAFIQGKATATFLRDHEPGFRHDIRRSVVANQKGTAKRADRVVPTGPWVIGGLTLRRPAQMGGGMEQPLFAIGDKTIVDLALRGPPAVAEVAGGFVQIEEIFERVSVLVQADDGGGFTPRVFGAAGDVNSSVRSRLDAPAGVRKRALGKFVVFPVHEIRG